MNPRAGRRRTPEEACSWAALTAAACLAVPAPLPAAEPPPGFPIGIYGVSSPSQLKEVARWGFDAIYPGGYADAKTFVDIAMEAKRQGLKVLAYPLYFLDSPAAAARPWPILAWYLHDEPDGRNISPAELGAFSRRVRDWDPARPQAVCLGRGESAGAYGGAADIVMVDWYPVPHRALDSVADQADAAIKGLPPGKPLWFVIQAFDWRDYPPRSPSKARAGRFPDHWEIRFMSYLAIVHGAKGLFYYTLGKPGGRSLLDVPEEWQALARAAREIADMKPVFEGGEPRRLPFEAKDGLEGRAWRRRLRDYVVALNRGSRPVALPPVLLEPRWRPLFEVRRDLRDLLPTTEKGLMLEPRRVVVFESRAGVRSGLAAP